MRALLLISVFILPGMRNVTATLEYSRSNDSKNPNRPDPKWICYHGIEVFSNKGKVSTVPKDEWDKNRNAMRESTSKYIEQLKLKDK